MALGRKANFLSILEWVTGSSRVIDTSKIELVLLIRRYEIPEVPLSCIRNVHLQPADKVKPLELILDRKLS